MDQPICLCAHHDVFWTCLGFSTAGGECVYYFVDQLIWLVKAGLLPERFAPRLNKVSAWGPCV